MNTTTCLSNIIGLTNRVCDCLGTIPEQENVSKSGFYVDDIFEASNALKLQDSISCDDEIWDVLQNARQSAIDDFLTDIQGALSISQMKVVTDWTGVWGDPDGATKLNPNSSTMLGIKIEALQNSPLGLTVRLNSVGLLLDAQSDYIVKLYSSKDLTTHLKQFAISTKAGIPSMANINEVLLLPMWDSQNGLKITYYLVYEPAGANPYSTQFWCNCGGKPGWGKYLEPIGLNGFSSIGDISGAKKSARSMHGLITSIQVTCGAEWICYNWDYTSDPWARTMAKCISMRAHVKVLEYILNSGTVNKYTTLLEPEWIYGKLKHYAKEIEGRMNYLSTNLPVQAANCWTCYPSSSMGTVLV